MKKSLIMLLCGFAMAGVTGNAALAGATRVCTEAEAQAQEADPIPFPPPHHPEDNEWAHHGFFGQYDVNAARRGLQVYREVCAACHSLQYVAFRDLAGLGYSEEQIKVIAAEYTFEGGPDEYGDMFERPGRPYDYFPSPFANEQAARASNNGALPPDLSLITKARASGHGILNFFQSLFLIDQSGGEDYIHSLLTGYQDPPDPLTEEYPCGTEISDELYYNPYFANHQIAMAPPLFDDLLTYDDGTEATLEQMSHDVVTFLSWTAEPKLDDRKRIGFKVMIFLLALAIMLYFVNKKVWARVKGTKKQ